jgi:hypothetical protein
VELEFGVPVDPRRYGKERRSELIGVVRDAIAAML